jgi:predicted amidophosphoribosyltransferase
VLVRTLGAVAALVLPRECGGCGVPDTGWCDACAGLVARATPRRWYPSPVPAGLPPTVAALPYAGPVRRALVALKDGGRHDLVDALAPALAVALAPALAAVLPTLDAVPPTPDAGPPTLEPAAHRRSRSAVRVTRVWVVPVPSAAAAVRRRGERPTVRLARAALGHRHGAPLPAELVPALRLDRATADQAGLDAAGRAANLRGAMSVRPRLRAALQGRACVVVDDVVTTGATLAEAAGALRAAGSGPVMAATVAATARRPRAR